MRPTTKRRLTILLSVLLLITVTCAGVYLWTKQRQRQRIAKMRSDGLEQFAKEDYGNSLRTLSSYFTFSHKYEDAEPLFAYAKSRVRVEDTGGKNFYEGLALIRQYLNLNPADPDANRISQAKHILLDLYAKLNFGPEGLKLADEILAINADDKSALKDKAIILMSASRYPQALEVSLKSADVSPLDLTEQIRTLELLKVVKQANAEILERTKKLRAQYPNAPQFVLLEGYAHYIIQDERETTISWLRKAAKLTPPDAEYVRVLAEKFEQLRLFEESRKVMEASAQASTDPQIRLLLVRRLWQTADFPGVITRTDDLVATDLQSNTQLLAFRAMAMYQVDPPRSQDAAGIVSALGARRDDPAAAAWAIALKARYQAQPFDPRAAVGSYREALARDGSNLVIRYMMGEAYSRMGENELAIEIWNQVEKQMPTWSMPGVMISQIWGSTGRINEAVEMAQRAFSRSPSPFSAGNYAVLKYRQMELSGHVSDDDVQKLAADLGRVQEISPGESQSWPLYVRLLARTGKVYTAKDELAKPMKMARPPSQETLLRLAAVSHELKLGKEDDLYAFYQKTYGDTATLASVRAANLNEDGKPQEGLKLLQSSAADHPGSLEWAMALARYRQSIKDPSALQQWAALGDAYPKEAIAQNAILESEAAWGDRALIQRTIDRLHDLTGEEGIGWRLARARWLLSGQPSERETSEAITLLNDITSNSPNLLMPRLMLSRALVTVNNTPRAVQELRAAADLNPRSVEISLELARLLQSQGHMDDALTQLRKSLTEESLTDEQRTRLASALSSLGDDATAQQVLSKITNNESADTRDGLMADLDRKQGKFDEAKQIYVRLLQTPKLDPGIAAAAAEFFASLKQMDLANQALDKLRQSPMPKAALEVTLGTFNERYVSPGAAREQFIAATTAAPKEAKSWLALAGFYLRAHQWDDAVAAANEGLKNVSDDKDLASITQVVPTLKRLDGHSNVESLADELSIDPRNQAALDTLAAIDQSRGAKETTPQLLARLRPLGDHYPRFLPVQNFIMQGYLVLNQPDQAADLASRVLLQFPNSSEAAREAAAVFGADSQWRNMLGAARQWRLRAPRDASAADLAIAEASLHLNDSATALAALGPYVEASKGEPDKHTSYIATYAQALVAADRAHDAAELLDPLAKTSSKWRQAELTVGARALTDKGKASDWIDRVGALMPTDSVEDRQNLAMAWYDYAMRFHDPAGLDKTRQIVQPLLRSPGLRAAVVMVLGSIYERNGDLSTAETTYRRALEIDPQLAIALNNLAFVLYSENRNLEEAADFARRAIAKATNVPDFYDTLARIYVKLGQRDLASQTFSSGLELDPDNIELLIGLAQVYMQAGRRPEVLQLSQRIDDAVHSGATLTPDLEKQLDGLHAYLGKSS